MKNRPLIYGFIALLLIATIWRISNPPQLPTPGPVSSPPHWSSTSTIGDFVCMQVSPDSSQVAGIWVSELPNVPVKSGLRIMRTNINTQIAIPLMDGFKANGLSWKGAKVIVSGSMPDNKSRYVEVDPSTQRYKTLSQFDTIIDNVISWPADSKFLLSETTTNQSITTTVLDDKGSPVGKSVVIPNCTSLKWNQTNTLSTDGDCAVISVLPIADSSGFPNYYYCDYKTGSASLISNKLPGRVQELLVARAGVIIICVLRGKCTTLLYNPTDLKLIELKSIPLSWSPHTLWPSSKGCFTFFANEATLRLDLSNLSVTRLMEFKNVDSPNAAWQTLVANAPCVLMPSGDLLSISIDAGEPDIRRFSKNSSKNNYLMTPILPRQ